MTLKNRPKNAAMLAFIHDLVMTAIAFVLALYLRVGDAAFGFFWPAVTGGLPIVLAIAAITYQAFGLYRSMWRFVSLSDLIQIAKAVTVTVLALLLAMFLVSRLDAVPRSHPPIFWFVLIVLIGAPRLAYRVFSDRG
ncbi:MAG: polysaccharide biosynthesis protein, partial [Pseudomonadota bacterium]